MYTYTENNPVNYTDPSGHGIWSKIKSAAKKVVNTAKNAYDKAKTWAKNTLNTVKTVAKNLWFDVRIQKSESSKGNEPGKNGDSSNE